MPIQIEHGRLGLASLPRSYITDGDGSHLQGAIDIALRRFAEYHSLEGAFGRRAVIERAKGILMERHGANDDAAFAMLREHSQHTGRKLFDIAQAILDSHLLLSPTRIETITTKPAASRAPPPPARRLTRSLASQREGGKPGLDLRVLGGLLTYRSGMKNST